ncbi:MAG: NADH-quinone oxidoreductase subunit L [Desulfurococcales archaeon]|nr:NADH-quinone oxidoreductase subunit L [Desulfurococcales archaeon]
MIVETGSLVAPNSGLMPWALIWGIPYLGAAILAILYYLGVENKAVHGWGSVVSIGLGALVAVDALFKVLREGPIYAASTTTWVPWINVGVGVYLDGLGAVMAVIVGVLSFLIAVYSVEYMRHSWGIPRYFFFFTFFVASMLLLVTADNLILMFIGWEGTGLASYALIGHWYTDEEEYWVGVPGRKALGIPMYFTPSHSGVRAMLFTRIGDIGMMIGMATLFLLTGTFSIPEIAVQASHGGWMVTLASKGVLAAVLLVFTLGALAKSAQFPFQEWLVTAMTGPTPVSALIHAATMVKAGVYFMLRMAPVFLLGAAASGLVAGELAKYFVIVAGLGAITAFMLATMALVSNELKLILAYSTASQLGYMFVGVAAAGAILATGHAEVGEIASLGVAAGLSHLLSHAIFKAALFLIAGWLIHAAHSRFIDYMGNYAKYMKLTALSLWLAGLSLMAIPPMSGFFSKELTLKSAEEAHLNWVLGLGVLTAGLTAAYTLRMILRVLHLPPKKEVHEHPHEAPPLMLIPYFLLALTALVIGIAWFQFYPSLAKAISETLGVEAAIDTVKAVFGISLSAVTATTLGWVFTNIAVVAVLYLLVKTDFDRILQTSKTARVIHDFLFDRWYINSIIYILIVGGFAGFSMFLAGVDHVIDLAYHAAIPALFALGAAGLRALHRGRSDYYLMLYVYFASVLLLFLYIAWG